VWSRDFFSTTNIPRPSKARIRPEKIPKLEPKTNTSVPVTPTSGDKKRTVKNGYTNVWHEVFAATREDNEGQDHQVTDYTTYNKRETKRRRSGEFQL
jgi:hypothetical protein